MRILSQIKMWFWTKKRVIQGLMEMDALLDALLSEWIEKIKLLDQSKVYVLPIENAGPEEINKVKAAFKKISARMEWTPPEIIVINHPIVELGIEDLKKLEELIQKKEGTKT